MPVVFVVNLQSVKFCNEGCTVKILHRVDGSQPFSNIYGVKILKGLNHTSWIAIIKVAAVKSIFDIKQAIKKLGFNRI